MEWLCYYDNLICKAAHPFQKKLTGHVTTATVRRHKDEHTGNQKRFNFRIILQGEW